MLTLHLKSIIFSALQLKSFQPLYTSVENSPRVSLSDRSGIGTGLARQPISLSQASSRGWLKMASPRESQQLAITLTVCLHQSTCVCWPSNMMSLLISCIPLMGSRGEPYPHSRHFLSWCIVEYVHFLLGDQLDFFKVLLLLLISLFFISPSFQSAVSPLWCYLLCFVIPPLVGSSSTVFVSLLCEYLWWFPLICRGIHWTGCNKPFDQASDFMNRYWRCLLRSAH